MYIYIEIYIPAISYIHQVYMCIYIYRSKCSNIYIYIKQGRRINGQKSVPNKNTFELFDSSNVKSTARILFEQHFLVNTVSI